MIVQIGCYPPPFGGVSIYIKRLKDLLDSKSVNNEVWDYSKYVKVKRNVFHRSFLLIPFYYGIRSDIDLIHYNISGKKTKIYIGFFNRFLFKNRKKIITIHGDCKDLFSKHNKLMVDSLNSFDAIICVKNGSRTFLQQMNITPKIYEIAAFLPPSIQENEITEIDQKVWDFFKTHHPVISANASTIAFYSSQDLYGIDMCIELCARLKKVYPNIGFVFCLPEIKEYSYYEELNNIILRKEIHNNFLFFTQPCQFYPILMRSDVFVRPTNTDGDAISVREALYFKIPTVASDIVARPEGTVLFENRNITDFSTKVLDVLSHYTESKEKLATLPTSNSFEGIMNLYKNLILVKGM